MDKTNRINELHKIQKERTLNEDEQTELDKLEANKQPSENTQPKQDQTSNPNA